MDEQFEAGQVWEYQADGLRGQRRILAERGKVAGDWTCACGSTTAEDLLREDARLIAPAPKPGQRWGSAVGNVWINACIETPLGVYGSVTTGFLFKGSVVTTARWLLEHGYQHVVEEKPRTLQDGDVVRCEEHRSTGRVFRPSTALHGDFDVRWTADGKSEEPPVDYTDTDASSMLEDGTWTVLSQAPAKPRVELRDGMRVALDVGGITGELRRTTSGKWHSAWSDGDEDHFSDSEVVRCIESGRWAVVEEAPKMAVRLRDGMRIANGQDLVGTLILSDDGWCPKWDKFPMGLPCSAEEVGLFFANKIWTVVDDAPSAPVAAPAPAPVWDRAASRRAVDAAVAKLRGEPFAEAVRAVLVALSGDTDRHGLTATEIDAAIVGCQAWEKRRAEVPFPNRVLNKGEALRCRMAAVSVVGNMTKRPMFTAAVGDALESLYERARSADKPAMLGRPNRGSL